MVWVATDDKSLPKDERKAIQIAAAPVLSPGAKLIKLADKISNVRSVALSPPIEWSQQRRVEYVEFCRKVVAGLRGTDATLEGCSTRPLDQPTKRMEAEVAEPAYGSSPSSGHPARPG